MKFIIEVKSGYSKRKVQVERIFHDERTEQFRLTGRDRSITLQSNRPFFRNRGLKHRKPDWKIIEGQAFRGNTLDAAIEEIMKVIDK